MMYALGINQSIERMCVTDNRHFIIGHYYHLRSPMGKLWVGEKYRDARIKHRKEGLFSFSFKTTSSICTSKKEQKKKLTRGTMSNIVETHAYMLLTIQCKTMCDYLQTFTRKHTNHYCLRWHRTQNTKSQQ